MKKIITLTATVVLILSFIIIQSCKKEEPDAETVSVTDNSLCEAEFSRIMPEVNGIAIGDKGVNGNKFGLPGLFAGCPDDSIDPADTLDGFPVTLYVLYGNGCVGTDGKKRSGTIRCVFDSAWDSSNPKLTVYLENYFVNGIKYEGTVVVIKDKANLTLTQIVQNGKCSKSGSSPWEILWNSSRTFKWVSGNNTPLIHSDDVFEITGSADGVNREGNGFGVSVATALIKSASCAYITKGELKITPEGKSERIIDYGDGACDNLAKMTINGNSFNFTLK